MTQPEKEDENRAAFREDARKRSGLMITGPIVATGEIQRPDVQKPDGTIKKKAGAYAFRNDDGLAHGWHMDWSDGRGAKKWSAAKPADLSEDEAKKLKRQHAKMARERNKERERQHAEAAEKAQRRWNAAKPADPDHGYLKSKGIQPHGIRQRGDRLFIPLYRNGAIISYQEIDPDGTKDFDREARRKAGRTSSARATTPSRSSYARAIRRPPVSMRQPDCSSFAHSTPTTSRRSPARCASACRMRVS